MSSFFEFITLQNSLVRNVVIGVILLSVSSSIVGVFTFLRKRALVGDAVSHAVLPGVCLAFIVQGSKNPFGLLIGAFIAGWLSLVAMDIITTKSRIKEDTAIGIVLTVFFGLGTVLLSYIQQIPGTANQGGLDHFLFGDVTAISEEDLIVFGSVAFILIVSCIVFFKEFFVLSFDESYARSIGFPAGFLKLMLTTLTVFAVVIGIQAVGVVLMAAMLITPAAAARFWTDKIVRMLVYAAIVGLMASVGGTYISYETPSPTGPWIVMILSMIALTSFLLSPQRGILSKMLRNRKFRSQIMTENILKAMYQISEKKNESTYLTTDDILNQRKMQIDQLKSGLKKLRYDGFISKKGNTWKFTREGRERGQRLLRLHRLWELYLTEKMNIAPDHVHEDADTIEHIITPEIEARLEKILDYPERDPHDSEIPYRK